MQRQHQTALPEMPQPVSTVDTPDRSISDSHTHTPMTAGSNPDAPAQVADGQLSGAALIHLQQSRGNRYVQRLLETTQPTTSHTLIVQTKLILGPTSDRYEREADRVAQQITSGHAEQPAADKAPQYIMRVSAAPATYGAQGGAADPGVQQAIHTARGGQPLPEQLRGSMEQALGADFGGVRLHTDAQADQLNRTLQARAFTTGRDIFFRRGEYNPDSSAGQRILAHELTHVVQQGGTTAQASSARSNARIQRQFYYGQTPIDPQQSEYILHYLLKTQNLSNVTNQDRIADFRATVKSENAVRLTDWLENNGIRVKTLRDFLTDAFESAGAVWIPSTNPVSLLVELLEQHEANGTWDEKLILDIKRTAMAVDPEAFLAWLQRNVFPNTQQKDLLSAVLRTKITVNELLTAVFPNKDIAERHKNLMSWGTGKDRYGDKDMGHEPVIEPTINLDQKGNDIDPSGERMEDPDAMDIDTDNQAPSTTHQIPATEPPNQQDEASKRKAMLREILTVASWNLEKYGAKTDADLKEAKRREIIRILSRYQPTLFTLQEVTDAILLYKGKFSNEAPVGYGLALTDLLQLNEGFPVEYDEKGRQRAYPLQQEYNMVAGPRYEAGKTYKEYYPLFYKTAEVIKQPEPYFVIGQTEENYRLVGAGAEKLFSSGKKSADDAEFREPLFWYVERIDPYTVSGNRKSRRLAPEEMQARFPRLGNEYLEPAQVTPLFLGVVHTSPSNVMGIKQEITELMAKAKWLENKTQIPVHLAGDFYMEKQAKDLWQQLTKGKAQGWELGASEKIKGDTLYSRPFVEKEGKNNAQRRKQYDLKVEVRKKSKYRTTNFPHSGQGQTADMQVNSTMYMSKAFSTLLPPNINKDKYMNLPIDEDKDLGAPLQAMGADHATTFVGLNISAEVLTEEQRTLKIREAKKRPRSPLEKEGRKKPAK